MEDEGGEATFDAFFDDTWPRLQSQAYVLTGSHEQAQDMTQEALLRAWRNWGRVAALDNPEAWTRKVLHNLCITSWRKSRHQRTKHEIPRVAEIPDSHMEIAQVMRSLPGDQARALLLCDGLGMTSAEVGLELGVPEGTVKSWLRRSRKLLAVRLQQLDQDPLWK
jgi:RNA polymerase sigma-70 factor, ECF subfamily